MHNFTAQGPASLFRPWAKLNTSKGPSYFIWSYFSVHPTHTIQLRPNYCEMCATTSFHFVHSSRSVLHCDRFTKDCDEKLKTTHINFMH